MKIFTGKVISKKMNKTATVLVERVVVHPVYKKRFKLAKKYHVHDELGTNVGDIVSFVASKQYSKMKKWKIIGDTQAKQSVKSAKTEGVKKIERKSKGGKSK